MQEAKSIIVKPCARALIVYYVIALSIIAMFTAGAIVAVAIPMQNIDINPWFCILGVVGGLGVLAIVIWIHLEMKTAIYTVTESNAQSR